MQLSPPAADSVGDADRVDGVDGPDRIDWVGRVASSVTILVSSAYLWTVVWLLLWTLVPLLFGLQPLTVHSDSMAPGVRTGDVVGIAPQTAADWSEVDRRLGANSVIAFRSGDDGRLTLHRIVEVDADGYRTKGDANQAWDSGVVQPEDVDGVARLLVPSAGWPAHWAATGQWHLILFLLASVALAYLGQRSQAPPERSSGTAPVPAGGGA